MADRHHTTLGYYEFGGTATIIDPRKVGNPDADLTLAHEQCHRDLVNATVYGYVLTRLPRLARIDGAAAHDPGGLLTTLAGRMWNCAEGSATAAEMLVAPGKRSPAQVRKLIDDLPPDYRAAREIVRPIADRSLPILPPPINLLLNLCLLAMVAEAAADWSLFTGPPIPDDFWSLADRLRSGTSPDAVLPDLVASTLRIPLADLLTALDRAKRGITDPDSQVMVYNRNLIRETKAALLRERGIDPQGQPLLDDGNRVSAIEAIDAALVAQFPALPRITWLRGVTGAEAEFKPSEPERPLPEEQVTADGLLHRVRELARADGFHHVIFEFFRHPATNQCSLMAKPIHVTEAGLDLGSPFLTCMAAPPAIFHDLAASGIKHVWQTPGLPLSPDGFYDAAFTRSLGKAPVYLQLDRFSWEMARSMLSYPRKPRAGIYILAKDLRVAVAAMQEKNITVFGLTIDNFPDDFTKGQKTRRGSIRSDPFLGSVAMNVYRSSRENAVFR